MQTFRAHSGISAEVRIQERRQLLLDTAFEYMKHQAWRSLTINKLCQLANLNKRYFYESFEDLESVIHEIYQSYSLKLLSHMLSSVENAIALTQNNEDFAELVLGELIDFLSFDEFRIKILFTELNDEPRIKQSRQMALENLVKAVVDYAYLHYQQPKGEHAVVELTASLLIGGTLEVFQRWMDGKLKISKQQLVSYLAALWRANGDVAAHIARSN